MKRTRELGEGYTLGEDPGGDRPTIGTLYAKGRVYYNSAVMPSGRGVKAWERRPMLQLALASCQQALTLTGTQEERLIQIDILLLMMDIVTRTKPVNTGERERYFYRAVEIARHALKEDYLNDRVYGDRLREYYTTYIDTDFGDNFSNKKWSKFIPVMQAVINAESDKKISSRTKQISDTKNSIKKTDTPQDILMCLENALGPVRLMVIAGANGEIMTQHRIERPEAKRLQDGSHGIYTIQAEVWDKKKGYQYLIDRGSAESQFTEAERANIIEPILQIYIERLESLYFSAHADHGACIREHEESRDTSKKVRDYSAFIHSALTTESLAGSRDESEDATDYARAIDIARLITSHHHSKIEPDTDELYAQIDGIMGGTIDRRVYTLVSSILLSRNETMHGTGYPFGLNQSNISIEGRLYGIIRSYETLSRMYPRSPKKVISALEEWGCGGYLDQGLLSLFITTIGESRKVAIPEKGIPTDRRIDRYKSYQEHWGGLITHIDEMEGLYDGLRGAGASDDMRKTLIADIGEKRHKIHRHAALENIIIIERHEQTESDTQTGGAPGSLYEGLTDTGMANAIQKGKILKRLLMQIYRSPLPRARETAELMYQQIRARVGKCLGYSRMQSVESLNNTIKNREDGQSVSFMSKFINLGDRQKELYQFVLDIVSSTSQSVHLIITHGDIIRHLLLMFENLFDPDKFIGVRHPVEQQRDYTLLFRGDQIVDWDLLFSITDWELMVSQINEHTERIFGSDDMFSPRDDKQVSLIRLRDELYDYIDNRIESHPERVGELIAALDVDPLTAHFSQILRSAGVIKNPQE